MITIENKRLHDLIVDKDALVNVGRGISKEIDLIDAKVKRFEAKEKALTGKVIPPKELTDRGDSLIKEMMKIEKEINKISQDIQDSKMAAIPKEMIDEHKELLKQKESKERERNKVALKVQKIKDKCVPIIQKEVKPLLNEYDDIETAKAIGGKVVIATFNHLADFKAKFRR
jgi:seryl-tRNA synthetase